MFTYAAILDPNFSFDLFPKSQKPNMIKKLKDYIEVDLENTTTLSEYSKKKTPPKFWTVLPGDDGRNEDDCDLINNEISSYIEKAKQFKIAHAEEAKLQNAKYSKKESIISYADTLLFWKTHENEFKFLAKKAKFLLSIPATSASVERFFSKTGYIMRPHRRRLNDDLAEKLFFLKGNSHLSQINNNN